MSSTPSRSRSHSHSHSRQSSIHSRHVNQPSRLRQSHAVNSNNSLPQDGDRCDSPANETTTVQNSEESTASTLVSKATGSERDKLVDGYFRISGRSKCNSCGTGDCEHGVLSPRAWDDSNTERDSGSYGGKYDLHGGDMVHSVLGDAGTDGLVGERIGRGDHGEVDGLNKMSTANWLAREHGISKRRTMYVGSTIILAVLIGLPPGVPDIPL